MIGLLKKKNDVDGYIFIIFFAMPIKTDLQYLLARFYFHLFMENIIPKWLSVVVNKEISKIYIEKSKRITQIILMQRTLQVTLRGNV